MSGPRSESSVDIEAGEDGSFHVAYGIPGTQAVARREVFPSPRCVLPQQFALPTIRAANAPCVLCDKCTRVR